MVMIDSREFMYEVMMWLVLVALEVSFMCAKHGVCNNKQPRTSASEN